MAEKKKAYQHFGELTRRATAPMTAGDAPTVTLPVRLEPDIHRALEDRAAADHTTPSEVIRAALRRYLESGS